jgi:hypothetical protein
MNAATATQAKGLHKTAGRRQSPVPKASGGYLGDLVTWRFGAFKASRTKVHALFGRLGFESCLAWDLSSPGRALQTAKANGIKYGERIVARTLERPNRDTPVAIGVYERQGKAGEGGDDLVCGARVRIASATNRAIALAPEGKPGLAECLKVAEDIAKRANELIDNVENAELSHALVAAGAESYWAPFRSAGGVYWVPASKADAIRELFDEVEKLGEFYATIQPLFGDDSGRTGRNVSTAAAEAVNAELAEILEGLESAKTGRLLKKGIQTRVEHCQELMIRLESYRVALAEKADTFGETLTRAVREFEEVIANANRESAEEFEKLGRLP